LGNFDWDDQTIYHDITDTSEISTADDNISDIDNAEINRSTSSASHFYFYSDFILYTHTQKP
jgi:hypothetical protein